MSITRRQFLKTCSLGASTWLTTACSLPTLDTWMQQAPAQQTTPEIHVWSSTHLLDGTFAHWRRTNDDLPMVRQSFAGWEIVDALARALRGDIAMPDVVIAPSSVLAYCHIPGVWRTMPLTAEMRQLGAPAGFNQFQADANELFGLPLTLHPLGIWYHADLVAKAGLPAEPVDVSALWSGDWQAMWNTATAVHETLPLVETFSSIFDDIYRPQMWHHLNGALPVSAIVTTVRALSDTCQQMAPLMQMPQMMHYDGTWFDAIQRERVVFMVAGRDVKTALQRTQIDSVSAWRVATPPTGLIAGDSLGVAIPVASNQTELALRFAEQMHQDIRLQTMMSEATQSVPCVYAASNLPEWAGGDAFAGGQELGAFWSQGSTSMQSAPRTALHSAVLRRIEELQAAYWSGRISETLLWQSIESIDVSTIKFAV